MTPLRFLAVGLILCLVPGIGPGSEAKDKADYAKLLVGKWEVTTANEELPVGSKIEFGKEGKMKITHKQGGKEETAEAVYRVEGGKIAENGRLSQATRDYARNVAETLELLTALNLS